MRGALLVLIAALASGCFTPPQGAEPGASPNWRVVGAFDANATQADVDHAQGIVAGHGGLMQVTQGSPRQFIAGGLTQGACDAVHDALAGEARVARVSACEPVGTA